MRRIYDPDLKATLTLDKDHVRAINFAEESPQPSRSAGKVAPKSYIRSLATTLMIPPEQLSNLDQQVTFSEPEKKDVEFRLSEEKTFFDTTTYVYRQTYLNTPIWSAGVTATIKTDAGRVLSVTNTSESGVDADLPPTRASK